MLLSLRDGGHGWSISRAQHGTRNARVVVAQVILALMVRCFWELRAVDPGFEPDGVPTFRLPAPLDHYEDPESVARGRWTALSLSWASPRPARPTTSP